MIENGLVLRPGPVVEVPGSSRSTRSLHPHAISPGHLTVFPTQEAHDGEPILVTDGGRDARTCTGRSSNDPSATNTATAGASVVTAPVRSGTHEARVAAFQRPAYRS